MADQVNFNYIHGLDEDISREFHSWVCKLVSKNLKEGFLGEKRTRMALVKTWQEVRKIGTPGLVTKALGEERATKLYEDICDYYRSTPEGLRNIREIQEADRRRKATEDMFNQR